MEVRKIMTGDPVSVEPDTTLEEIATLMKEQDIGAVPVVEEGELCGIVTDRDIVVRCIAAGQDATECTAEDVMSTEIQSLGPDASVDEVARLMGDLQIRRLPIVEKNRLVGMVSLGDLAVKSKDDDLSGDTLEDVSKGVKQSRGGRASADRSTDSGISRHNRAAGNARAEAQPLEAETGNLSGRQSGADRSGVRAGRQQTVRHEAAEPAKRQPQGLKSDSSARKQGIANRNAKEENARNDKVIPFRSENEVRNTRVQKPARGKRKSG
jgi:CBS domain-containing protein